ncbi:MAG TPA: acyltransferase [Polyangiales bacterium]|nr:acyltransferase [Polyangiales bacterium]
MARGVAALAVCSSHLRSFLLLDWADVTQRGPLAAALYVATGFSHQAVIVFFVLSGFLVGGNAMKSFMDGQWSFREYWLRRLTRLWIVLLPALILTAVWNGVLHHIDVPPYANEVRTFIGTPDYGPAAFLGNLAFLQTILVPTYGNNGPLWSLANEFWYYVLFPLALSAWFGRGYTRVLWAGAAIAIAACLPWEIVSLGTIWLMGVAAFRVAQLATNVRPGYLLLWRALGLAAVGGALVAIKLNHALGTDYTLGAAFAAALPSLVVRTSHNLAYTKLTRAAAEVSYTLYLVHYPALVVGRLFVFDAHRVQPTLSAIGVYALALIVTLLYSALLWWLFERHTAALVRILRRRFFVPTQRASSLGSLRRSPEGSS